MCPAAFLTRYSPASRLTRHESMLRSNKRRGGEAMAYELRQVEGTFNGRIEGSAMNVLVVDDRALNRELLRNILAGSKPNGDVVETSASFRDGFSACAEVRDPYAMISIIVLSARQDTARKAHELGPQGAFPKSANGEIDLPVLQIVLPGSTNDIPPNILAQSERELFAGKRLTHKSPSEVGLTARQANVLALILQGKSNKAICRLLHLAEPTVKNHVTAILRALKVTNRTEAAITAKERGWELSTHFAKYSRSRTSALPQCGDRRTPAHV
jgi:DNA-binding NarL/FixJ family response regulator